MRSIVRSPQALSDIKELYAYFDQAAGEAVAERFMICAQAAEKLIAQQPKIGKELPTRNARLRGVRRWRIKRFEEVLIFYLVQPKRIMILRILHGARDWWGLLGIETQ